MPFLPRGSIRLHAIVAILLASRAAATHNISGLSLPLEELQRVYIINATEFGLAGSPHGTVISLFVQWIQPWLPIVTQFHFHWRRSINHFSDISIADIDYFTHYMQLRTARNDKDFEIVRDKLRAEWYDARATSLIIAAADAAVYGFSQSGDIFEVDEAASGLLILSATSAAFGLCLVLTLQLRYSNTDAVTFAKVARGKYDANTEHYTYVYFAVNSRLPLLALCISLATFSLFLLAVAYTVWPRAVLGFGLGGAVIVGMQYIVRSVQMAFVGVGIVLRAALGIVRALYIPVERTSSVT